MNRVIAAIASSALLVGGLAGVHDARVLEAVFQLLKVTDYLALIGHFNVVTFDVDALDVVEDLGDELHLSLKVVEVSILDSLDHMSFLFCLGA